MSEEINSEGLASDNNINKSMETQVTQEVETKVEVQDEVVKARITSYNVCYTKLLRHFVVKI